jgi:acylphosphatase
VGFRPFIYTLASRYQITGWVRNTSSGVEMELSGEPDGLTGFMNELRTQPPRLARIDHIRTEDIPAARFDGFEILESQTQPGAFIPISPDMAICPDCQRELFDPKNRPADEDRGAPMLRHGEGATADDPVRLAQADREIAGNAESQRNADQRRCEAGGCDGGENG